MASPHTSVNFPHSPPPPSSQDGDTTVIVVVFVSFGCIFFFSFLLVALCCFIKRSKKKKSVQETDIVHANEHMKVKEAVVPGPHGAQAVVLTIEDDVHIEEVIRKNETLGKGTHAKSTDNIVGAHEAGEPSSTSGSHHDEHQP